MTCLQSIAASRGYYETRWYNLVPATGSAYRNKALEPETVVLSLQLPIKVYFVFCDLETRHSGAKM